VTFEIPLSFTEKQIKESFSNATQLNGFLSMLYTSVENSMSVKLAALFMRTINNMIRVKVSSETVLQKVNLLAEYNGSTGESLTVDDALQSPEFIRYATYTIGLYSDRMSRISKLFNAGNAERFTPHDMQKIVLLSDFAKASETFLLSNTFNEERVLLPRHETIPYFQGSGETYSFEDVSKISVKTSGDVEIEQTGLIGVIFDRDALGVANLDRRVTTNYNPKAEFYTNFYKFDAGFFNDLNENFVVFYIEDEGEG